MNYNKSVVNRWFQALKNGTKTIEGRPLKSDFANMKIGDTITFSNDDDKNEDVIVMTIIGITKYNTFKEYLEDKTIEKCLPGILTVDEGCEIYYGFPNFKQYEKDYGVVAIELKF